MSQVITPDQVRVGQEIVLTHSVCGVVESIDYPYCTIAGSSYSLASGSAEAGWSLKIVLIQDRLPLPNRWAVVWYKDGSRAMYWIDYSLQNRDGSQLLTACLGPQKIAWSMAVHNAVEWEEFTDPKATLDALAHRSPAFEDRR